MAGVLRLVINSFPVPLFSYLLFVSPSAFAKDGKEPSSTAARKPVSEFQWKDHSKLSWDDFKGPVDVTDDESAAATHCGLGFKVDPVPGSDKPKVTVYNAFYANRSWVRPDGKLTSILDHEQGHFDLCEIYTRKLKRQIDNFDFNVTDVRGALVKLFTAVNAEYEQCQQVYESETTHGTNIPVQRNWQNRISRELN